MYHNIINLEGISKWSTYDESLLELINRYYKDSLIYDLYNHF